MPLHWIFYLLADILCSQDNDTTLVPTTVLAYWCDSDKVKGRHEDIRSMPHNVLMSCVPQ